MQPNLSLQIDASWDEVDRVRDWSTGFLRELGLDDDAVDALTMVACELTENAVKYGGFDEGAKSILVTLSRGIDTVIVEVKSPVPHATDDGVAKLDAAIQWIRGHQDPFEAYLDRLKQVSGQHMTSTESGLGLVRIAYEGRSILDFYIDDQDMLSISAVYPLEIGASS